jgi:hypothetical protein
MGPFGPVGPVEAPMNKSSGKYRGVEWIVVHLFVCSYYQEFNFPDPKMKNSIQLWVSTDQFLYGNFIYQNARSTSVSDGVVRRLFTKQRPLRSGSCVEQGGLNLLI